MAMSPVKATVSSPPPPTLPTKVSHSRSPDELRLPYKDLQARIKVEQPKLLGNLSRRDAMFLASAGLLGNLIASDAAEARRVKPETRQKIKEKLDKLREKGGVMKEKTDPNSGNKEPLNMLSIPLVEAAV